MIWLVLGVIMWSGVHFIPSIGIAWKGRLIETWGNKTYTAGFSVDVILSIVLMVVGWRTSAPANMYQPPVWGGPVATVLMILAFTLFGAAKHSTRIKQFIRHPQLASVIIWAGAHLLSNGDSRSVVLFGGLGLWAIVEIPLINAREGERVKPEIPTIGVEVKGMAISMVIFAVAFLLHPYFAGVSPIPH